MSPIAIPRPGPVATRIARLLRPAAMQIGAWVSAEAAVQLDGHPLYRPAVVVVEGEPPYDGVARIRPLLVVEVTADKVTRWAALRLPSVWGPYGDGGEEAVEISPGARHVRGLREHLTVPGHPGLVLPVAELLREPPLATVIQLPR